MVKIINRTPYSCFSLKIVGHDSSDFPVQPLDFGRNRPDAGQYILTQHLVTHELHSSTLAILVCRVLRLGGLLRYYFRDAA